MVSWVSRPPRKFDIATGFFPEANPKANWSTNPRPMLVTGVFQRSDGAYAVRAAYGTTQIDKVRGRGLEIGNLPQLDKLGLKRPTTFVLRPGSDQQILLWSQERFACWTGHSSPIIGRLPDDMAAFVTDVVRHLPDLPMP